MGAQETASSHTTQPVRGGKKLSHHRKPAPVNVPLNNRLDETEPVEAARGLFERRWSSWNLARTVLCTASFVALLPALS